MTPPSDYTDDMPDIGLSDHEVESILSGSTTGSDDLADVEGFVAVMSNEAGLPRDAAQMATRLAALARSADRPKKALVRRLVPVAVSVAALLALSGVAMAADKASPGESLYGVDLALERIGIGDGGVDERMSEFDSMLAVGEEEEAFEFLAVYMESAERSDADRAQRHLELAAAGADSDTGAADEKVASLRDFIEQNKGEGVGVDGREFGRRVSEIARSRPDSTDGPEPNQPASDAEGSDSTDPQEAPGSRGNPNPGPPDHAGPPDTSGPPDNPGPPDHAETPKPHDKGPAPPDDAGPPEDGESGATDSDSNGNPPPDKSKTKTRETGPPDHAGPPDGAPGPPDGAGPKK